MVATDFSIPGSQQYMFAELNSTIVLYPIFYPAVRKTFLKHVLILQ